MSPTIRKIVAMLKMQKRLRQNLRKAHSRVASAQSPAKIAKLKAKIAKLGGALELEMDRVARAQFLEGMFMGPGKQSKYPSRRLPRARQALEVLASILESAGATPEAIDMWTTPKNTKFFMRSWQSVEPVLAGYHISTEDVAAWMVSGITPAGHESVSKTEGLSTRLFERVGQDHFRGKEKIKSGVLIGELTPRQVAKYTQKRVFHKALNVKDSLDRELAQTDYIEGQRVRDDEDALLSETVSGGDVFDRQMTREDAMLDLMTEGHAGATETMEGLLRSVSSDRDREVLRMVLDIASKGDFVEKTTEIDEIVAARYRDEMGEPISPRQVSNIRRKQISQAMKPAYDGARVLADALDEAGGSDSTLRDIMIDNLLDTEDAGPRLYPILPRAYSGGSRNKFWIALKQILIEDGEFLVSYEDLLQRMVEEVDPRQTSEALIQGLGLGSSMLEDADTFVKMLAEDLIALLKPIAEGMGLVDDEVFLRNELEMGRIRNAAKKVKRAMNAATVEAFLLALSGRLTRYDQKQQAKGRGHSPYALGHWLGALDKVRNDVARHLKDDSPEAMEALKASLDRRFINLTPVNQVIRMIDAWLEKGKMPRYAKDKSKGYEEIELEDSDQSALDAVWDGLK